MDFFIEKCNIYPTWGKAYGDAQFIRLNMGAPQKIVQKMADNIKETLLQFNKIY